MPKDWKTVRLTGTRIQANQGIQRVTLCWCSEGRTVGISGQEDGHER